MKFPTYFVKEATHRLERRNQREMRCIWSLQAERIFKGKRNRVEKYNNTIKV